MGNTIISFILLPFLAAALVLIGVFILSLLAKLFFLEIRFCDALYDLFCFAKVFSLFMCAVFLVTGIGSVVIHSLMMIANGKPIF